MATVSGSSIVTFPRNIGLLLYIIAPIPPPAQPRPRFRFPTSELTLCWRSRMLPPADRHRHRGDSEVVAPALAQRDRDCKS